MGLLVPLMVAAAWGVTLLAAYRFGHTAATTGAANRDWLSRVGVTRGVGGGSSSSGGSGSGGGATGLRMSGDGAQTLRGGGEAEGGDGRRPASPYPGYGGAGAHPVSVYDVAIVINVAPDPTQWAHNYRRIFSQWGADMPYVYWVSNFTEGVPPRKPHAIALPVPSIHDRYGLMLGTGYRVAPASVRWFMTVDEDTFLFVENLLDVLAHYDPAQPWYIGDISEDAQGLDWYTRMAYGGGGAVFSRPVVEALMGNHDYNLTNCNARYERISTGDERLSRCIGDLGVSLTRHAGFHQVDVRGDLRHVLQYVYSTAPLVSLHHVYSSWPIFLSDTTPLDAMDRLLASYRTHRHVHDLFLALHFSHLPVVGITVALNVGYSVRVWQNMIPSGLFTKIVPEFGFSPWQPRLGFGYSFDAAPVDRAFVCSAAMFEWHPSPPYVPGKPFEQVYRRALNDGSCSAEETPAALRRLEIAVVMLVPCNSQPERVRVRWMTSTTISLAVIDCRRQVRASWMVVVAGMGGVAAGMV